MICITIDNVVTNAAISGHDIEKILESIPDAQYRPNRFPALGVNVGKSKVWLFDSGKISSAGSKSINDAIKSINLFIQILVDLGMKIKVLSKPKIVNIVIKTVLPKKLDLVRIKYMKEFVKEIPTFGSILLSFENNTSVRVYQNSRIVASNDSIDKIIHTIKKLEKYQIK